jgi:hypothetical protein
MSDMPGYAAAQAAYDNMTPPDDGPYECPECGGSGHHETIDGSGLKCSACDGFGMISENGEPHDPHAKDRAEAEYADMKRDERLTSYRGGYDEEDEPQF